MMTMVDQRPQALISVVIATYLRNDFLVKCLNSIIANEYDNYEIIIVDQGIEEETRKLIGRQFPDESRIVYIYSPVVGLSHARNIGWTNAKGEIVAFIDDDAVASVNWLSGYADIFENMKPLPAMVGGKIEPAWEIERPVWYPEERQFLLGLYDIGDSVVPFPETDLPVGANFAVRRSILDLMGGFDQRVGFDSSRKNAMIAGEDSLLALKVRDAGHPIFYCPEAKINHHVGAKKLSRRYFLKRHYWEGYTQMVLEDCKGLLTSERSRDVFIWHAGKIVSVVFSPIICMRQTKNKSSFLMLQLSKIAYSCGICISNLAILFRRIISRFREGRP